MVGALMAMDQVRWHLDREKLVTKIDYRIKANIATSLYAILSDERGCHKNEHLSLKIYNSMLHII